MHRDACQARVCFRWSLRQGIISKHSTAASLSPQQASHSSPSKSQFLNILRPRRYRRSRHDIHFQSKHGNPSSATLAAEGKRGYSAHAPFASCVTCVFDSPAVLLTETGVLLGTCRAWWRASMRCPSLLEGAAASFCALPLAAEGKRGYSAHALFVVFTLCL